MERELVLEVEEDEYYEYLRGKDGLEFTREREREKIAIEDIYYMENDTRITRRVTTRVELNWFEIMPCASFYSVLRSTLEVSRMFQRNLENIHQFSIVK